LTLGGVAINLFIKWIAKAECSDLAVSLIGGYDFILFQIVNVAVVIVDD